MSVSWQAQKGTDKTDGKTSKESTPRHHYERTTGTTGGTDISQHQAAGPPHDTIYLPNLNLYVVSPTNTLLFIDMCYGILILELFFVSSLVI